MHFHCPCSCRPIKSRRDPVPLGALCLLVLLNWETAPTTALLFGAPAHPRPLRVRLAPSASRTAGPTAPLPAADALGPHSTNPTNAAPSAPGRRRRKRSPADFTRLATVPDMSKPSGAAPSVEDTGLEFMVANDQQAVRFRPPTAPLPQPQPQLARKWALPVGIAQRDDADSGSAASVDRESRWPYYVYDAGAAEVSRDEPSGRDQVDIDRPQQMVKRNARSEWPSGDTLTDADDDDDDDDGPKVEDVAVTLGQMQDWSAPQRSDALSRISYRIRDGYEDALADRSPTNAQIALDVLSDPDPEPSLPVAERNWPQQDMALDEAPEPAQLDAGDDSPQATDYALLPLLQLQADAPDEEDLAEASAMGGMRAKRLTVPSSSSSSSFAPSRPPLVRQDAVDIPDEQLSGQGVETSSGDEDEDEDESDGRDRATGVVLDRQAAQLRRIKKSVEDLIQRNQDEKDALQVRRLINYALNAPDDGPVSGGSTLSLADLDEEFDAEQGADTAAVPIAVPSIRLRKRDLDYQLTDSEAGQLDDDDDEEEAEAESHPKEDVSVPLEMPSPEADDLAEAVAGRFRVCDMVHNRFYRQMLFTGKTLEVDECYVSCERRDGDGDRVFSHIFKLVDWPCGAKLEGRCDKQGVCSAF